MTDTLIADTFDFSQYTIPKLLALRERIDVEVINRREAAQRSLIEKFQQEAAANGLDFDELVGGPRRGRRPRSNGSKHHHSAT